MKLKTKEYLLFRCHYEIAITSSKPKLITIFPDFLHKESQQRIERLMKSSNTAIVKLFSKFVYDCFLKRNNTDI